MTDEPRSGTRRLYTNLVFDTDGKKLLRSAWNVVFLAEKDTGEISLPSICGLTELAK